MVEILRETESTPSTRPEISELSAEAAAIDSDLVFKRLEDYAAYRCGEREVVWILQGPGTWEPRLKPITIDQTEVWDGDWQPADLKADPLGYELDARTYRVTATVGSSGEMVEAYREAYRRLAQYFADLKSDPALGIGSLRDGDYQMDRHPAVLARALQYSGAADLLRGLR